MAMAPWIYEKARKAVRFHLQVEVVEVAGRRPAHVVARVVRVFRGHERIRVGEAVEFDVPVVTAEEPAKPGSHAMRMGELVGAKYLEVFLDGEPPRCDPVGILLPMVIAAPSTEPMVQGATSAAASTRGASTYPTVRTAPPTALAAANAPATTLAPKSSVPTSLAPGPAPPTSLAPGPAPPTSLAPGPAPPTSLVPDPTLTAAAAPSPPASATPPAAPLPPAPAPLRTPLRRPTMQGRAVPPVTEVRPLQRNPTLSFPPGKLPSQADASLLPPLPDSPTPEPWAPPPLEPEPAVPPPRRRTHTWTLFLIFLLVFVLGSGVAFFLIRNKRELVVGPGHISTIGEALQRARTGRVDTIRILPGIYPEALRLDKKVRLVGEGPREEIVVNSGNAPPLTVEGGDGSVTGLTLRCDTGPDNAKHPAVRISQGSLELENCDIGWEGEAGLNRKDAGACVEAAGAEVRLVLKKCRLHHGYQGLWVKDGAKPEVEECTIENNQVGVWADKAGGLFKRCEMRQNHAVNVFAAGSGADVQLEDCQVLGGEGDGVVFEKEAEGKVVGGTIQAHQGKGYHAAWIREKATASLSGCDVSNNQRGIRVTEGGKVVLSACKIHDNTGLALEVRGADSYLDASACKKADLYDNGEPWAFDDEKTFRKPN